MVTLGFLELLRVAERSVKTVGSVNVTGEALPPTNAKRLRKEFLCVAPGCLQ